MAIDCGVCHKGILTNQQVSTRGAAAWYTVILTNHLALFGHMMMCTDDTVCHVSIDKLITLIM